MSLEQAKEHKSAVFQAKKDAKRKSSELQDNFVDELETHAATEQQLKHAKEMTAQRKREIQEKESWLIKRVHSKLITGGISYVVAPNEAGELVDMQSKEDIEQACLQESNHCFWQASNTPFLQPPLFDEISSLGFNPAGDAILNGFFEISEGTDPYTAKLICHLWMPDRVRNAPPVDTSLNIEDYRRVWQRAKEKTSSGISGLHFGNFKAGAEHEGICRFEAIMSNIPYRTGYSPPWCKKGINTMLLKRLNDYWDGKLWAILFYKADYNQNNKQCGTDMMENAELHNTIARESEKSCCNWPWLQQVSFLCPLMLYHAMIEIVYSVAALAMKVQGMPEGPITSMFNTIQELDHFIWTVYRDAEQSFNSNNPLYAVPVQGVGQGNRVGPSIWAVVSSPVLEMLREAGCCCFFQVAISGEDIPFVGNAFVDDTDQVVTCRKIDATFRDVVAMMQKAADEWEGDIQATGGAIGPDKSFWYLLDFVW